MLDQEEAWWLTKLVFRGILIFIVLKLVLAFILMKIELRPLDLGTQYAALLISGVTLTSADHKTAATPVPDLASNLLVKVGTETRA